MYHMFQISGDVIRALGLKMKILMTVIFGGLLIGSVILLSFSHNFNDQLLDATSNDQLLAATINGSRKSETPHDKLIGGLLTADFDEPSCVSRYYQSSLYSKPSPHKPSEYLVSKLRSYEKLHKRCGPGTEAYKEATKNLGHDDDNYANKSVGECKYAVWVAVYGLGNRILTLAYEKLHKRCGPGTEAYKEATKNLIGHDDENYANRSVGECRYIVWVAAFGLGNRILTLASVFLHALLTDRVVLVDQSKDINDLFCEPFPGTSWLLPNDFPLVKQFDGYGRGDSHCYGTMLNNHAISANSTPRHIYLDILHDSRDEDKMFFCPKDQTMIDKVPWLVFKTNVYFVPSLWFSPTFRPELMKLFPQKEAVFHHLARYLFHPTNQVWGMVTRYYKAHLARADERLGIQIRVFADDAGYFQHVMDQILSCTQREKLLPQVVAQEESKVNASTNQKLKAVLVTSLYPEYADRLKSMFWERPSSTGEIIEVYQPSGERVQQTDKKIHDQKALAEMYLLSLTDNIVTSARSTFGYVAHSLGGLKPWLLYQPKDLTAPDPPCIRSTSVDPCHLTPPSHGCDADWGTYSGNVVPFVRECEDREHDGIKLFDEL
uniref:Fucosyltransferase n=1 Tax=Brassica campestris TaxID=3711 RepID=M4DT40_BRACM